jgi:hypothetical protein
MAERVDAPGEAEGEKGGADLHDVLYAITSLPTEEH